MGPGDVPEIDRDPDLKLKDPTGRLGYIQHQEEEEQQNNNSLQPTETPPTSPSLRGVNHKLRLLSNNGLLESTPSQDDLTGVKDAAGSVAVEGGIGEWCVRPEEVDVVSPCMHRSRARAAIRKQ